MALGLPLLGPLAVVLPHTTTSTTGLTIHPTTDGSGLWAGSCLVSSGASRADVSRCQEGMSAHLAGTGPCAQHAEVLHRVPVTAPVTVIPRVPASQ